MTVQRRGDRLDGGAPVARHQHQIGARARQLRKHAGRVGPDLLAEAHDRKRAVLVGQNQPRSGPRALQGQGQSDIDQRARVAGQRKCVSRLPEAVAAAVDQAFDAGSGDFGHAGHRNRRHVRLLGRAKERARERVSGAR